MHVVKAVFDVSTAMKISVVVLRVMTHCSLVVTFRRNVLPPSSDDVYPEDG